MSESGGKQTIILLLFSVASFALSYTTAIVLARTLGPVGYDDYTVAISSAAILVTLAEMGTGKLAMRIMPALVLNGQWSLTKGYRRYSAGMILLASIAIALVVTPSEFFIDQQFGNYALGIAILFLPFMAWVAACAEFVMANRAAVRAAFVMRLLLPGSTLALVAAWAASPYELTASHGVLCYGFGSVVGLAVASLFLWQTTPRESFAARPDYQVRSWFTEAMPFLFFTLLITLLGKVGVIILELVHPQEAVVAVYSVALDTGTFIFFVAKSTDKMFLPEISLLLERQDVVGLERIRRWRWSWMGAVCGIFVTLMFLFGRSILSLFGEQFVAGYPALCIIAIATSVWTMTSISPTYLNFVRKHTLVVVATGLAVVLHIGLCFPLGYRYGATGAALSYAIPVVLLYTTLMVAARRHLRQLADGE